MSLYNTLAILLTLSALFSYINHRVFKLPTTIGLMLIALLVSMVLLVINHFEQPLGFSVKGHVQQVLGSIDFGKTLLHGMLSYLLFAGALHVNLNDLAKFKWVIGILATFGVVLSTILVACITWLIATKLLGLNISFLYCLIFGALISPTDPIAVISILKNINAPKKLETKIAGESLFNDGIGVVVFLVLLSIATSNTETITVLSVSKLFLVEVVGGIVFGLIIGAIAYFMLRSIDNYSVEILITLAIVSGGYALATALHASGPIAVVIAGLIVGNHGRSKAMSEKTRTHLDMFWELIDEVLNAVLFVLIGFEVLVLTLTANYLLAGAIAIPTVLLARFIAVSIPVLLFKRLREFSPKTIRILTWGGLRGGISVALALSLPEGDTRNLILTMTYTVVAFSILVQGLTIGRLVRSCEPSTDK
ncbi:Na+/H+ antiporter, NhaP family [hydrothermal vent metagenome]|uniref:Na+/H+ antiporter, NhaP family n=1 Tax=hydrothermal vent metagenome TaxID=652676 RepID=A0A3B0YIA6_9ZZZZ